jgi:hypothetical protein
MHDEDQCHTDAIVVMDKGLSAALSTKSHKSITTFYNQRTDTLYHIFEATQSLRDDVHAYHIGTLDVRPMELADSLEALDVFLMDYVTWVAHYKPIRTEDERQW